MVALLSLARKAPRLLAPLFALLALAACEGGFTGGPLINTSRAVPVALLVPQSSPTSGDLAVSLVNAARMAAGDLQGASVDLKVYDTAGTPDGAVVAAQKAMGDGAKIIVGPLFGEAAAAVGPVAAARGVNVLTFSNNPAVAGGNVFILGNTFQTSADRLVRYAAGQGKGDIFIIYGDNQAEQLGRDSIQRAIQANGGTLAGEASFPVSRQGVIDAIPTIAQQIRTSGATSVFLTSGTTGALGFLAGLLPENGITPDSYQLIGLQRLDVPSSALSIKGLQGAWFAVPSPTLSDQFAQRYQAAYGVGPSPVAGLAYDAIAAVGALIAQGHANALTTQSLTQGQGFAGVNGPFRLFPNGTNERGLAVAQIENNQVIVIDPAPTSFGGTGF